MNNETVAARFRFVSVHESERTMWQRFIYDLADNITMNFRPSYKYPRVSRR